MAVQHGIPSVNSSGKKMHHVQPNIKSNKIHKATKNTRGKLEYLLLYLLLIYRYISLLLTGLWCIC
jgi:hypothetical protein